jgi:hypothetical protein
LESPQTGRAPTVCSQTKAAGTKYNLFGLLRFLRKRERHEETLQSKLNAFFEGQFLPEPSIKKSYHCSEFIVACFTATGIIEPSAAIVYRGSVISPGDLGRDATFGFFDGYLTEMSGYQVPQDDRS